MGWRWDHKLNNFSRSIWWYLMKNVRILYVIWPRNSTCFYVTILKSTFIHLDMNFIFRSFTTLLECNENSSSQNKTQFKQVRTMLALPSSPHQHSSLSWTHSWTTYDSLPAVTSHDWCLVMNTLLRGGFKEAGVLPLCSHFSPHWLEAGEALVEKRQNELRSLTVECGEPSTNKEHHLRQLTE